MTEALVTPGGFRFHDDPDCPALLSTVRQGWKPTPLREAYDPSFYKPCQRCFAATALSDDTR